jgi:hypothetical protein
MLTVAFWKTAAEHAVTAGAVIRTGWRTIVASGIIDT